MSHTKPIDLGHTLGDSIGEISVAKMDDTIYPTLHIPESDEERLLDLPDEGTAEIHYKIVRRHHTEEANGKKKKRRTCSITMEIRSLEPGHDPKFNGKRKTHWEMFNS
jgi:hypothetical protein